MRQRSSPRQAMREHLEASSVQRSLQHHLATIRNSLTTPIGAAARMIGVTEAQLRYWESLELLSPVRSGQHPQAGQRHYSTGQLARALIIKELLNTSFSLADIGPFLKHENTFIESITTEAPSAPPNEVEQPQSVTQRIRTAEEALLWEFFLPRALYSALSLLFESAFTGDGRIYLPIGDANAPPEPIRIERVEDLPRLGNVLLGYREPNHAFAVFPLDTPPPEPPGRYEMIPLEDILPPDADGVPVGAHLALVPPFAALLKQRDLKPASMAGRRAAGRLLKFLQDSAFRWREAPRLSKETLLYDSPTLTNPSLGDPLLNALAEIIVALGGREKGTRKPLWRFCCILVPDDLLKPLMQRSLTVRGQSRESPHKAGVTKLSPGPRPDLGFLAGMSILAYQSGVIIYRPQVTADDPAIAWREREEPIGSAIAVPLEGEYGRSLGVVYVVSEYHRAFSVESQQLLRIMGRLIGEQVTSSRSRQLTTANLHDLIEDPESVELILKGLRTINEFRSDLRTLLEAVALGQPKPFESLAFIAIDIDNLSGIAGTYGDQAATRNLVNAVGQRLQEQMLRRFSMTNTAGLYRAYMDRFYQVLKDVPPDRAKSHAEQLKEALGEPYRIYASRVSLEQTLPPQYLLELQIMTRLAVTSYSSDALQELLQHDSAETIIDRLERKLHDALFLGKHEGGNVIKVV